MSLENCDQDVIDLLLERHAARNSGDFLRADEIRNQLRLAGIAIRDDRQGTLFYRSAHWQPIRVANPGCEP